MSTTTDSPAPSEREALELLMQRTQRLLAQYERLVVEHENVVQRARSSAEQVVRLQGEVDALRAERNAWKTDLAAQDKQTGQVESHSTYSQPDPTSAALPKEVINEIVQEIDACIALLQR